MRLIDADQMAVDESEAYMSAQVQITDDLKWLVNFAAHSKIQKLIADTPTIDAVPVVRCRECKYWKPTGSKAGYSFSYMEYIGGCEFTRYCCRESDFCSYGERKEGDTDGS